MYESFGVNIEINPFGNLLIDLILVQLNLRCTTLLKIFFNQLYLLLFSLHQLDINYLFFQFALHQLKPHSNIFKHFLLSFIHIFGNNCLQLFKFSANTLQTNYFFNSHIEPQLQLTDLRRIRPYQSQRFLKFFFSQLLLLVNFHHSLFAYARRMLQHQCFCLSSLCFEISQLNLGQKMVIKLRNSIPFTEDHQWVVQAGLAASHFSIFSKAVQYQAQFPSSVVYQMHNFRKVKKKKKIKTSIVEQKTPQETLIQISNSRQEQPQPSDADFFIQSLENYSKISKEGIRKDRKIGQEEISEKIETCVRFKKKLSVQQSCQSGRADSNDGLYSQVKSKSVRFIYLKSPKNIDNNYSSKNVTTRSKTLCDFSETSRHRKISLKQMSQPIKGNHLNLKGPMNISGLNYVPPFIVKNIKLDSRYPQSNYS